MLDLFIMEGCPFCKKVTDFMESKKIQYNKVDTKNPDNILKLMTIGGKDQVPFLYDTEKHNKIYESDDIIEYIKTEYNHG